MWKRESICWYEIDLFEYILRRKGKKTHILWLVSVSGSLWVAVSHIFWKISWYQVSPLLRLMNLIFWVGNLLFIYLIVMISQIHSPESNWLKWRQIFLENRDIIFIFRTLWLVANYFMMPPPVIIYMLYGDMSGLS